MTLAEACAAVMFVGIALYALLAGADFGAGFWDLVAGGARRGARRARSSRSRSAPVWEANHVWLIFVLVTLWTAFPVRVRTDHVDAVRPAHARRRRHHPARRRVRVPQGVGDAPAAPPVRRRRSRRRRCSRRSCSARSSAASRRDGCRPASGRATSLRSWLNPDVDARRRDGGGRVRVPRGGVPRPPTPSGADRPELVGYFRRRALGERCRRRCGRARRRVRAAAPTRPTCSTA